VRSAEASLSFTGDRQPVQTAGVHADAGERVVFGVTALRNNGAEVASASSTW
jgi:hypothetical protein